MNERRCHTCKHWSQSGLQYPCSICESFLCHTNWEPVDSIRALESSAMSAVLRLPKVEEALGNLLDCYLWEASQGDGIYEPCEPFIEAAAKLLGRNLTPPRRLPEPPKGGVE